ncbi:MAG TPA: pentapeptide repeat-containing protein [Pyrinomonadaceae bacterium]
MPRSSGLPVKKPVSVWNREVKVNFRDLFKALGKAVVSAKVAKFDLAISSLVDSVAAFELKKDAGQMAWLLICRSISRAMFMLIEDNLPLIREATRGFRNLAGESKPSEENLQAIADKLDYAVDARDLAIDRKFFERPREFPVIEDLKKPLAQWLQGFGLNSSQAHSICGRFPSYFVFALNDEWRERRADYNLVTEEIETPFTKAAEIERAWSHYYASLQKRVDEPLFQEAFSLRQIYIPLRAYFEQRKESDAREKFFENDMYIERSFEKVVIDLEEELESWVDNSDEREAIRILSGGPGYGKSSVARMFAAKQSEKSDRRVLFIPLHLFEPTEDLVDSIKKFVEAEDFFPPVNFLHPVEGEKRLLLIFDGLDELSMQGKVGNEIVRQFVKEVQRKADILNRRECRLKVLICGRDISVQTSIDSLDRKTKVLNLLPYFVNEYERDNYIDKNKFLIEDKRNLWWKKYGKVIGKDYRALPAELNKENLTEITALPLLNYLVALSYTRGKIDFARENNLNSIYQDLLESVYQREDVWADKQHTILEGVTERDFFRIFEEIALAAWHSGEGRKVSIKEIEKKCEDSGLKPLLEKFQKKAKDGVASLLIAFYFRKAGVQAENLNETFEFTHKSFTEYLTARRIVRGIQIISDEMKRRQASYEIGWDEISALTHWVKLCGLNAVDEYLLDFIRDEIALMPIEIVMEWQKSLGALFSHVLRYGMPMEKLADDRPNFKEEIRRAQNSEEALLVVLNACALVTKQISDINFPNEFCLEEWLRWIVTPVSREVLTFMSFEKAPFLYGANLEGANLEQVNLSKTNLAAAQLSKARLTLAKLERANLSGANLSGAVLWGANLNWAKLAEANLSGANLEMAILTGALLRDASLKDATLTGANLSEAMLTGCNLSRAVLTEASLSRAVIEKSHLEESVLIRADLSEANLSGANLYGAVLEKTNLKRCNLAGANLERAYLLEANLEGAYLSGAIWIDGRKIIGGKYPDLIFEGDKPEK